MAQDWHDFTRFAIQTARSAGDILLRYQGKLENIRGKSAAHDMVTEADLASEKSIIHDIRRQFPHHGILSEETGAHHRSGPFIWVIDPLDGTTNYIHGYPVYAVSIALQHENRTLCAVVYNPADGECYHATAREGAFLNGQRIAPSGVARLKDSLLVTGFPYLQDEQWHRSFELFRQLYGMSHGVRRLGAASLDLCYVAAGRFDAYWEFNLKPWDVAAGALILQEAGGMVSDWDGSRLPDSGVRILGSNGKIHPAMVTLLTRSDIQGSAEKK